MSTLRAAAHATALLLASGIGMPACAQWESVNTDGLTVRAEVRNDSGATVRISMDPDDHVFATFQLPAGLVALDPQGCPTFQIDDRVAENLADDTHQCQVSVNSSRVRLATLSGGRVRSPTLQNLMDGQELSVRYRLAHAGYGVSRFTLRRSRQALIDVLGESTEVASE